MKYKSVVAKLLVFTMIFQMLAVFNASPVGIANAIDVDGTANLDMTISSTVEPESIIGTNFALNISLSNSVSSESDAFAPGFIITLPPDVVFVSSLDLGAPVRTELLADGSTVLFFETDGFIPKGASDNFSVNLSSNTSADLFTPTDIDVLGYAGDNIYGVGAPPSGSPGGTLSGGLDYAGSTIDPPVDFPDNIPTPTMVSDLSGLPFFPVTTEFIPFNIEKTGDPEMQIGEVATTTLRITGNDLGPLSDFEIVDIIPNNRKFVGFTALAGATSNVVYDAPAAGQVTLTISNIDVPTGGVVNIEYETLALAYEAASYSGTTVLLNTGSIISDQTLSTNTATHQVAGTWHDGTGPVSIDPTTTIEPRNFDAVLSFGELTKSVNNISPVIGDTIRYTIVYDLAQNMAYDSGGLGTRIEDLLPDGLSFSALVSSTNAGTGDPLSLTTNTTDADGDTTLVWTLGIGDTLDAGDVLTIVYDVLVDGLYEGSGDIHYENDQGIMNNAQFYGNIADSGNDEEWGYTDPSHIGTQDTDSASATITAPPPTNEKQLVRIEFPDGTIYDSGNPLPEGVSIPVNSRLDFNISMDFPNVFSTGAKLIDALPLVTGPNTDTYNIAFQTNPALLDLNGDSVAINDDDADGIADTSINGQNLGGSTPGDTAWINTTPANNLEFIIGSGNGAKTFSIGFSVDVLPVAPSGGAASTLPIKNVLVGTYSDDAASVNVLDIINEPFILGYPIIEVQKDVNPDPTANIAFGDSVTYDVVIENTGDAAGYLEKIIDTLPDNMMLDGGSFTAVYSGSVSAPVPGASMTQSGNTLIIDFDPQGPLSRSYINIDDVSTTTIDESTILITYDVSPTVDFVIVGGEARENTISLDYYSTGDAPSNDLNKIDTVDDDATFTVASPTITRTYFSTSETDSPMNGGGGRPDIYAGEEVVFETTITLPPGTYTNSRFTESLLGSRLNFISGAVISVGPDVSFSTGTGFAVNVVNFGDIINSGTSPQDIVIQTTAIGRNDADRRNNVRARGDFRYSGQTINMNTPVDLIIPTLIVLKDVNPTVADTADPITYTIDIEHTGPSNATAYDIVLKDVLPPNVTYVMGTLTGSTNYIGTEADLFSGSGIVFPSLIDGATETLSFEAQLGSGAVAGATERNNVDIAYSSLDDDGSPVEANYTATNFADLTVDDVEITHYITATNNPDTGSGAFGTGNLDLTIGEELTYNIEVDMPALVYSGVTITQTLPPEFTFLTGSILVNGVASNSIETIVIGPDNIITFTFGDVTNTGLLAGAGFTLETQVVVNDIPANGAGDVVNSVAEVTYNGGDSKSDNSPNFDIVEPNVTIDKVYSPDTGDGGDSLLTTITITNNGTAPLYDVSWSDTLPPKTTADSGYLASSSTGVLLPGETISYTYNTILDNTVVYGEMLTGTASVMGDSMPGVEDEERDYSDTTSDIITITGITGLMKDLTSSGSATVGDIESYIIMVPVSEGVTGNITVNDLIPAGMEIIPGTINISSSGGISYSGTVTPTIGTATVGNTQTVDYVFSDITNSDTNNSVTEYITIVYDAVVLNTSDVNDGDTKAEDVTVNYNSGATILNDGPVPVNIVEPNVSIDLSSTYSFGNDVVYTYTITNTGSSTAYDLDIDTLLPSGLTYSGAITITNSGGVVGIIQSGEDFTIEELPVNTGSPLQFTIAGIIDGTVDDMDDLTVNADITYTGQNDTYTSVVGNTDNTERTGTNVGENDYLDSDPDTITVLLPILNEDISVVDLNGGLGIINDTFEYTITLTNSGSVNLTDISALLDVPAGFTGFTLISFPSGSTDASSATGGVDGAGQVDISDIDLLIGQSITIVYQVTALDTVPSSTTLNSEVTVSDTPEGAIGGAPDVDVTILAPNIQLSKSIVSTSFSDPTIPGDTITYQLIAENTGDVPLYNVTVDDSKLGGDITASCVFPGTGGTLDVMQSATCNPTNYELTNTDIIRGYVENSAEVMSEDESMNPVNDVSDSGVGNEAIETTSGTGATDGDTTNDPTVQALSQEPELTVTKVITATGFNVPNLVGDTITYEITIENTGNLAISGVTLTDSLLGGDITASCNFPISATVGLDVDEVATCNPANYSINANDIIRGYVDNNATARGTDALLAPVFDISDPGDEYTETPAGDGVTTDGDSTNDPTSQPLIGEAELRVTKVISGTSLSTPTASGDTIDYTITILNSGQLPVDTITLTDALLGGDITASCTFPISASAGLQVGELATCTPASYVINEGDIVRDYVDNNATARGFDPNSDLVIDVSDPGDESTETPAGDGTTIDGNATNDPTVQLLTPNPDWEIRKSTSSNPERVGDTLDYVFELENTGNVTINTPTVSDSKCSSGPTLVATTDIGSDGRLSPNEIWTYNCTSVGITQTEVDTGNVDNTVTANATTLLGVLPTATGATSTPIDAVPGWGIEKSTLSAPEFADDTLDYTFVLTNTGNVSISGVNISDAKCDTSGIIRDDSTDINSDNILYQGEFWRYSCTSIPVTQTEVNNQSVINTVTATGSAARGTLEDIDDTLDTFIGRLPRIQLYKSATFNDENADGEAEFGETISYNFTVRNTGNVDLTNVEISDPLIDVYGGPIALLPVDGIDSTTFTGSYFIIQPDVNAGYVENTASVLAQDIDGFDVSDVSDVGDDTVETTSGTGFTDSDPTNDPTVVRFIGKTSVSSGNSGGGSSSNSSSSSSGGGGSSSSSTGGGAAPVIPGVSIDEDTTSSEAEQNQNDSSSEDRQSIIDRVNQFVQDYELRRDLLDRLYQEGLKVGDSLLKALPSVLPQTGTPIHERVSTISSPIVSIELPGEEIFRLAGTTNSDLNHWIQVLPDQDKDVGKYVVVPSNGLVMPINEFDEDSEDFTKMINGREGNINPILESGALEYPGTSTRGYGDIGNKVIFGHSSYFSDAQGRYKTHFQKIIELDAGEQIWVYEKQDNGSYKRFVYVTEESYNTPANDTSVLNPGIGKNLTLFTCTPIGGIEGRWIIKAKYLDEAVSDLEREVYFQDVSSEYKIRIQKILNTINTLSLEERLDIYVEAFSKIELLKPDYENKSSVYRLLEFLQLRIAREILDIIE